MNKVQKNITLSQDMIERLGKVNNASALIERLLNDYFSLQVLKTSDEEELKGREKKLKEELDKIETQRGVIKHKEELYKELREIGVVDDNLIQQLINMNVKPTIQTVRHIKETYNLNSALQVWNAWKVIHEDKDEPTEG